MDAPDGGDPRGLSASASKVDAPDGVSRGLSASAPKADALDGATRAD